jgi:hypothetical protein
MNTNKQAPERDIGRVDRQHEVLRHLIKGHKGLEFLSVPAPKTSNANETRELFWMSERFADPVNITTFTTTPRGASPDPAKKVVAC